MKRPAQPKPRRQRPKTSRLFDTHLCAEPLEARLLLAVSAVLLSPADNGPSDIDPALGAVTTSPTNQFMIKLAASGGATIADNSVVAGVIAATADGEPLVQGNDYTFAYDAANDVITLQSVNLHFLPGHYTLTVSPNHNIRSSSGETLAPTSLVVDVLADVPQPFPTLFRDIPYGASMYRRSIDVPAYSRLVAGTSFEEPPLNATSFTSRGGELGWTRVLSNGNPGGNAVFGVKNSAVGLGAVAFPPTSGTKAYVSRGNSVQVLETLTFDAVDLTGYLGATFSMDVFRSNTGFENGDRLTITLALSNGASTTNQILLNLTGSQLANLPPSSYTTINGTIDAQYTQARLIIQSSTNSSQNPPDEVLVFDNIEFRGQASGGTSYYWIDLDAGQSLSASLGPQAGFRPELRVQGPGLAPVTAAAASAGAEAIITDYLTPVAGRYIVAISGLDETNGSSTLTLYTNATLEQEAHGGSSNDAIASAQNIDNAFISVDGDSARAGVWGFQASPDTDFYAVTLLPNESASFALSSYSGSSTTLGLFDAAGTQLAAGAQTDNVNYLISHFQSATGGTYYLRVGGDNGFGLYGLCVTRNLLFEREEYSRRGLLDLNEEGSVIGFVYPFNGPNSDTYRVHLSANQSIRIQTSTPGGGPLEVANQANPELEIYDLDLNLLFSAAGGAPDHKNVDVTYTAPETGEYDLRITSSDDVGEYLLRVSGLEPVVIPFEVLSTVPLDGQSLASPPSQITIDLNHPIRPDSIDAADLTVNGLPATDVIMMDGDTLLFVLPQLASGTVEVAIAAEALTDFVGAPLAGYSGQFFIDTTAPRVIASSIQDGSMVAAGDVTYVVQFSERMNVGGLSNFDFSLLSVDGGGNVLPQSASFDAAGTTLTIHYTDLHDGEYRLTLFSGRGALLDQAGYPLDGELPLGSLPPLESGDGNPGGDFSFHFFTDVTEAPLAPLELQSPAGTLVYATGSQGDIRPGDTDRFTIDLPAGYFCSVVIDGSPTLQPHLTLETPIYHARAAAPDAGTSALLQRLPLEVGGRYTINVAGIGGTAGSYRVQVLLNAVFENEAHSGDSNETLGGAQLLDEATLNLGGSVRSAALDGDFTPPLGYPGLQYANTVIGFSSQGDLFYSGAIQALGSPDTFWYGGSSLAWHPFDANDGTHHLAVGFAKPAYSDGILIRETSGAGFVSRIDLLDMNDVYHTVWSGVDPSPTGNIADFSPSWPLTDFLVKGAKIFVNTERDQGPEEIDAIQLHSPVKLSVDCFALHAGSGDALSISLLTASVAGALELLDANQQVLATASAATATGEGIVLNYSTADDGLYYLRALGDAGLSYSLIVLQNGVLSVEPNSSLVTAQDLTKQQVAVGYISASQEAPFAAGLVTPPVPTTLPINLVDGDQFLWDIAGNGQIGDGTNDAYDGGLYHNQFPYQGQGFLEDAGREVVIGPTPISNVRVTRKIYIPSNRGFARYLEIVTNPTSSAVNYTVSIGSDLGSDSGTDLVRTSSGDTDFTVADDWIVTDDVDGAGDPTMLHVIAGPGAQRPSDVSAPTGALSYSYALALGPGETKIVMHFASQNVSQAVALAKGPQLETLKLGALDGMSADELQHVVNFMTEDTEDFYSVEVKQGDVLDVRTFTPGVGLGPAGDAVDPALSLYEPGGGIIAVDGDSGGDSRNAHLRYEVPLSGRYFVSVSSSAGEGEYIVRAMTLGDSAVVARHVFYNNSAFDPAGGNVSSDDGAIAVDKRALLPGETATFENYTSYSRGINGVMIDLSALPTNSLAADDFSFQVGNSDDPLTWVDATAPASITVRGGSGVQGSDRVTLVWPDGAIAKQWLKVTVRANAHTGLSTPDVFYYGNAIGDSGFANPPGYATITAMDQLGPRNNPRTMFPASNQATIIDPYDYNRDKKVGVADQLIARSNQTNLGTALRLITAPAALTAPSATSTSNFIRLLASALVVPTTQATAPSKLGETTTANQPTATSRVGVPEPALKRSAMVMAEAASERRLASRADVWKEFEAFFADDEWLELVARQRLRPKPG